MKKEYVNIRSIPSAYIDTAVYFYPFELGDYYDIMMEVTTSDVVMTRMVFRVTCRAGWWDEGTNTEPSNIISDLGSTVNHPSRRNVYRVISFMLISLLGFV